LSQHYERIETVEGPTTGRKKGTPISRAWHTLQSKQSAEGHGVINQQIGKKWMNAANIFDVEGATLPKWQRLLG
jgi:hypothetical protein